MTGLTLPILGPLAWIDVVLLGWFALTALSVAYVAYDASFNNPGWNERGCHPPQAVISTRMVAA
jgi:hypothetical protein